MAMKSKRKGRGGSEALKTELTYNEGAQTGELRLAPPFAPRCFFQTCGHMAACCHVFSSSQKTRLSPQEQRGNVSVGPFQVFAQVHLNEQSAYSQKRDNGDYGCGSVCTLSDIWSLVGLCHYIIHGEKRCNMALSHTHTHSLWPHWQIATAHSRATAGRSLELEYTQKMRRNGRNRCMASHTWPNEVAEEESITS